MKILGNIMTSLKKIPFNASILLNLQNFGRTVKKTEMLLLTEIPSYTK